MALIPPVEFISTHNEDSKRLLLAAIHENQIIGVYNFGGYVDIRRQHRGALGISIHHHYRGEGIAKKLFEVSLDYIRSSKVFSFLELDMMSTNQEAFELYKKIGFQVTSEIPDCYRLEDGRSVGNITMRMKVNP